LALFCAPQRIPGETEILVPPGRFIAYKMAAVKILKTWRLKTTDGRAIYQDFRGNPTFEEGPNIPIEFIEGQTVQSKEALADSVGSELGAECVWKPGPDWSQ
jgi:hypothetical protein